MDRKFTKANTNLIKGIAILAMLFHHVYPNDTAMPVWSFAGIDYLSLLGETGKVCVALLTILSGYGICESYKKNCGKNRKFMNLRFILSHYVQMMSIYWSVWVIRMIYLQMQNIPVMQVYQQDVSYLLLDLFGISELFGKTSYIGGWFLFAIIVYYVLFPLVYFVVKKTGIFGVMLSYLPWIYYLIIRDISMHTDWWLFYLCAFMFGVYASQKDLFAKLKDYNGWKPVLAAIGIFIFGFLLRTFTALSGDLFYAITIIIFATICLTKIPVISSLLILLGENSANIWLLDGGMRTTFSYVPITSYVNTFLVTVFFCLGISLALEKMKDLLHIHSFVKQVRSRIL